MLLKYVKIVVQGLLTSFSSLQHAMELHLELFCSYLSCNEVFKKNNKCIYPSILFLSSILLGAFTWTLLFVSLSELFHSFQKGIPEWHRFFAVSETMNIHKHPAYDWAKKKK